MFKKRQNLLLTIISAGFVCFFGAFVCVSFAEEEESEEQVQQTTVEPTEKKLSLETGVNVAYDSNIFKYSSDDEAEFESYANTNKFEKVHSIDDVVTSVYLKPKLELRLIGAAVTTFSVKGEENAYSRNTIKNFETYDASILHKFGDNLVDLTYARTQDFFLRNLYDRDIGSGNHYRKARFDRDKVTLKYRRNMTDKFSWWLAYGYEKYHYSKEFKEYDNDGNEVNLSLLYRFTPKFNTKLYFIFSKNDADASDDYPDDDYDISNKEYNPGVQFVYRPIEKWKLLLRYAFIYRQYTTDKDVSVDPLHADRINRLHNIRFNIARQITKDFDIYCEYEFETKDIKLGTTDPTLLETDILGYNKNIISLGMRYVF